MSAGVLIHTWIKNLDQDFYDAKHTLYMNRCTPNAQTAKRIENNNNFIVICQ